MHRPLSQRIAKARSTLVNKAAPRPLYVRRPVLNASDIIVWAAGEGFTSTLPADDLHVTIAYSKAPVNWLAVGDDWTDRPDSGPYSLETSSGSLLTNSSEPPRPWSWNDPPGSLRIRDGVRRVEALGDKGAVCLKFDAPALVERWLTFRRHGCSWEHPGFTPHVTITYAAPKGLKLANVEPYTGDIVLGEEVFEAPQENWETKIKETRT